MKWLLGKILPVLIVAGLLGALVPAASADHDIPWKVTADCDGGFWATGPTTHTISGVTKNYNHVVAFWGGGVDGVGGGTWAIVSPVPNQGFVMSVTDGAACITPLAKAKAIIARECKDCQELVVRRAEQGATQPRATATPFRIPGAPTATPVSAPAAVVIGGVNVPTDISTCRYEVRTNDGETRTVGFRLLNGEVAYAFAKRINGSNGEPVYKVFYAVGENAVTLTHGFLLVCSTPLVFQQEAFTGFRQIDPAADSQLDGQNLFGQSEEVQAAHVKAAGGDSLRAQLDWVKAHNAQVMTAQPAPIPYTGKGGGVNPTLSNKPPLNAVKVSDGASVFPVWGVNVPFKSDQSQDYVRLHPGDTLSKGYSQLLTDFAFGSAWREKGEWEYILPPGTNEVWVVAVGDAPPEVKRSGNKLSFKTNDDVTRAAPNSQDGTKKPPVGSTGISLLVYAN